MKKLLFVCVHNAERSQMAQAFVNHLARERGLRIHAGSAGTVAGEKINPAPEAVMQEIGVPMAGQQPKQLRQGMVDAADRVITMGCGVDAEACPARVTFSDDWGLDDPAGQPVEAVRAIRDQIRARVAQLLDEIGSEP
jgi:arsenate reductase (thioredoxin)